jgi:membrane protein implicated in regulation of membrane protease activity
MLSTIFLILLALVVAGVLLQVPLWLWTDSMLLFAILGGCCWAFGALMGWMSRRDERELQRRREARLK